jgi:integrase
MTIKHITDEIAHGLRRGETIWDDEVSGFGVRRQRQATVFALKYSCMGHQRFVTLGHHCVEYTADHARSIAKRQRAALLWDPSDDVRNCGFRESPSATFSAMAEKYMALHAAVHKEKRTLAEDRRNLDSHILPFLGAKTFESINRADITAFQTSRSSEPSNANRCLALLSNIFSVAGKWGERVSANNPCRGVERYKETSRQRTLSNAELLSLGRTLRGMDAWGGFTPIPEDWRVIQVIRLLLLTGAKLNEILCLEWRLISWDGGYAQHISHKGSRRIPLPTCALSLLRTIENMQNSPSDRKLFVFPGKGEGTYFKGIQSRWPRVRRMAEIEDVRLIDLRQTFGAIAIDRGENPEAVARALGLKNRNKSKKRITFGAARAASERTAVHILEQMSVKPPSRAPRAKGWRF